MNSFAVRRGKIVHTFDTSSAAYEFWRVNLGSVFLVHRGTQGWVQPW